MSAMHLAIPAVVGASSNVILPVSTPMVMMHEIARVPFWRLVRCSRMTAGSEYEKQEKTNRKKRSGGDGKHFVTQDLVLFLSNHRTRAPTNLSQMESRRSSGLRAEKYPRGKAVEIATRRAALVVQIRRRVQVQVKRKPKYGTVSGFAIKKGAVYRPIEEAHV